MPNVSEVQKKWTDAMERQIMSEVETLSPDAILQSWVTGAAANTEFLTRLMTLPGFPTSRLSHARLPGAIGAKARGVGHATQIYRALQSLPAHRVSSRIEDRVLSVGISYRSVYSRGTCTGTCTAMKSR